MRDKKTAGVLSGLGLTRENLLGHGTSDHDYRGIIQPIVIETHPIHNSFLNYAVYLGNVIVPGILILLVLLTTTYAIGLEWKQENQRSLYVLSGESPAVALTGKLLPQTIIYIIIFFFMDVWFYRFEGFPCYCGLPEMMFVSVLTVLATQGFALPMLGDYPTLPAFIVPYILSLPSRCHRSSIVARTAFSFSCSCRCQWCFSQASHGHRQPCRPSGSISPISSHRRSA